MNSHTGVASTAFWLQFFASDTKAYLFNGVAEEAIVWNPSTMEIGEKTIKLGDFKDKGDNEAAPAYSDRAAVLRDGLLYEPIYWAGDDFFSYDKTTAIVVIDTEKDEVVDTLRHPAPASTSRRKPKTAPSTGRAGFSRRQELQCSINPRPAS